VLFSMLDYCGALFIHFRFGISRGIVVGVYREQEMTMIVDSVGVFRLKGFFEREGSRSNGTAYACALVRFGRSATGLLTCIVTIALSPSVACAENQQVQPTLTTGDLFSPSFKALFVLFILAVILESGLAIIFNWKLFFTVFDTKATKPLIAILVACLFVFSYKLDITTTLVNLYTSATYPLNAGGQLLTALVIAGGSSGVNRMFQALGFRSVQEGPPPVTKPPPTVAWLAVVLRRVNAVGTVNVIAGDPANNLVGTINGLALAGRIRRFFLKDDARFPPSGGHTLSPGNYAVRLEGVDKNGAKIESKTWGPYSIEAGSIVDVELTL
jgi:hypothetical protein